MCNTGAEFEEDAARQQLMELSLQGFRDKLDSLHPSAASEQLVVSVQVPAGLVPGDVISVKTEWGEMEVEIPEGLEPGDEFELILQEQEDSEIGSELEPEPELELAPVPPAGNPEKRARRPSVCMRGSFRDSIRNSYTGSEIESIAEGVPPS